LNSVIEKDKTSIRVVENGYSRDVSGEMFFPYDYKYATRTRRSHRPSCSVRCELGHVSIATVLFVGVTVPRTTNQDNADTETED
jgi:hypothetical protein